MTINSGTLVTAPIRPYDSADTYPVVEDDYLYGGYRAVSTSTARDNIPDDRRREGMVVYVIADARSYRLVGGITNANWTALLNDEADDTLRADLAASTGSGLVGYANTGTGAIARTVEDRLQERVSVLDYGAVADGVTDNTAVVQDLINRVQSGEFSEIYFPPGDYYFAPSTGTTCLFVAAPAVSFQTTPLPITISGAGALSKIIIDNTSANNVWMSGPAGSSVFTDNVRVTNLFFTSSTVVGVDRYTTMTNYGRAFNIGSIRRSRFEKLTFYAVQPFFQSNSGEDSTSTQVQQVVIKDCDSVGHQNGFINTTSPAYSLDILNNTIEAGNLGIKLGASSAQSSYRVSIKGNTIQSNGGSFSGIRLNFGRSINISENYFEANRASAGVATPHIFMNNNTTSSSIVIDSNLFAHNVSNIDATGGDFYHVRLDEVNDTVLARGNTFTGGNGFVFYPTSNGHFVGLNNIFNSVGSIYNEGLLTTGVALESSSLPFYETPTVWAPVVSDASTGGNTATATVQNARYTRVGSMVTVCAQILNIDTTGMTAGNTLYIQGLPYTSDANNYAVGSCVLEQTTFTDMVSPIISSGSDVVQLRQTTTAGNDLSLTVAALTSTTADIQFSITYMI